MSVERLAKAHPPASHTHTTTNVLLICVWRTRTWVSKPFTICPERVASSVVVQRTCPQTSIRTLCIVAKEEINSRLLLVLLLALNVFVRQKKGRTGLLLR